MEPSDNNMCLTNTFSFFLSGICTYQPSFSLDNNDDALENGKEYKVLLFLKKTRETGVHLLKIL